MKIQSLKDLEAIEERAKDALECACRVVNVYERVTLIDSNKDIPSLCAALREAYKRIEELETNFGTSIKNSVLKKCHDCGVKLGEFHLPGCDWEECPFCHRQLIGCDCCYEKLNIDSSEEPTFSQGLTNEQGKAWEILLKEKGLIPYGQETRF